MQRRGQLIISCFKQEGFENLDKIHQASRQSGHTKASEKHAPVRRQAQQLSTCHLSGHGKRIGDRYADSGLWSIANAAEHKNRVKDVG